MTILLYIYVIGCVVAFMIAIYHAYLEYKAGKDVSEAPAGISVLAFLSWYYVYKFFTVYYNKLKG